MEPSTVAARPEPALGGPAGLLARPIYRRLWLSSILYYAAYWVEIVTAGWVVLAMTHSALAVGLVGFCRMLPMLLLGMVLGAVADRIPRTALLLVAQSVGLLASASLAALFALGLAHLWSICLLTGALGCVWAADFSTRRALIAEVQGSERSARALSLEAMTMQGSKLFAAALAGGVLAAGGARFGYLLVAGLYATGAVAVLRLRRSLPVEVRASGAAIPLVRLVGEGFSVALRIPSLRAVLAVTALMNLLVFPYQQLTAVIAGQILTVGPFWMGLLTGADGIGAIVVAGLLAFRIRLGRAGLAFAAGALSGTSLVVLLGISHVYPLSLGLQIGAGACFGAFSSVQPLLMLRAVEPAMRARALGVLAMAIGCTPFGVLLAGTLSIVMGPSATLAGMGILALAGMSAVHLRNRALLHS
ncbi:MAG TPA: MFS transporter [Thermomicrobiaceae bacterium]|nr:MFS transporter [Thermomicrobiaceae bacterium]